MYELAALLWFALLCFALRRRCFAMAARQLRDDLVQFRDLRRVDHDPKLLPVHLRVLLGGWEAETGKGGRFSKAGTGGFVSVRRGGPLPLRMQAGEKRGV